MEGGYPRIVRKHKVGDIVEENGIVAILETEKATVSMHSPQRGQIKEFYVQPGETVALPGVPIVTLEVK